MGQYHVYDSTLIGQIEPTRSGLLRVVVDWHDGEYDTRTTRFPSRAARWSRRAIDRRQRRDDRARKRLAAAMSRATP